MRALLVLLGGLAGAAVGWIGAAAASLLLGGLFGLTEFEGERSMTAIFGIGPIGGVVGLVGGLWVGLRLGRRSISDTGRSIIRVSLPTAEPLPHPEAICLGGAMLRTDDRFRPLPLGAVHRDASLHHVRGGLPSVARKAIEGANCSIGYRAGTDFLPEAAVVQWTASTERAISSSSQRRSAVIALVSFRAAPRTKKQP